MKFDEHTVDAKADDKGNWKVMLPAIKADGKAHAMTIKGKKEIIERLKQLAGKSKEVFIATDPDREGEAIAYHLAGEVACQLRGGLLVGGPAVA